MNLNKAKQGKTRKIKSRQDKTRMGWASIPHRGRVSGDTRDGVVRGRGGRVYGRSYQVQDLASDCRLQWKRDYKQGPHARTGRSNQGS